jgi:hypothetical protein
MFPPENPNPQLELTSMPWPRIQTCRRSSWYFSFSFILTNSTHFGQEMLKNKSTPAPTPLEFPSSTSITTHSPSPKVSPTSFLSTEVLAAASPLASITIASPVSTPPSQQQLSPPVVVPEQSASQPAKQRRKVRTSPDSSEAEQAEEEEEEEAEEPEFPESDSEVFTSFFFNTELQFCRIMKTSTGHVQEPK